MLFFPIYVFYSCIFLVSFYLFFYLSSLLYLYPMEIKEIVFFNIILIFMLNIFFMY